MGEFFWERRIQNSIFSGSSGLKELELRVNRLDKVQMYSTGRVFRVKSIF